MMRRVALAFGVMMLAGCQTMAGGGLGAEAPGPAHGGGRAESEGVAGDAAPSCPETAYQVLVGQPIGEIHTASLPQPHRIYARGDMVTMDYRPERLNIVTGDGAAVIEVKCG